MYTDFLTDDRFEGGETYAFIRHFDIKILGFQLFGLFLHAWTDSSRGLLKRISVLFSKIYM